MDWQTLRNQFMRDIGGDPPGAHLEDELIQAYTDNPEPVERSFQKITLAYKAGKIRSPWGALKTEVAKATEAARNPTHDRGTSKTKAVQRAEQRIRNELLHYDLEHEVWDELFGDRGTLRDYRSDELEHRMVALWQELRPLGELVEHEAEQRGQRYQEQRERIGRPSNAKPGNLSVDELKAIARGKAADPTNLI
jgi:hypothetical protein